MTLTCSLLLTLAISSAPAAQDLRTEPSTNNAAATTLAQAARAVRVSVPGSGSLEPWMTDHAQRRPAALVVMYATLGGLHGLDVYSTRRAVSAGAHEANPLMQRAAASSGTMLAMKAVSTATAVFFAERAWKKNRKGTIVLMAVLNGATAAIAAHNFRNASR